MLIEVKEPTGLAGKEFSPADLERIAKTIVGKSRNIAIEYVRDVERCKKGEASKAVSLMEAAKIITFTKENIPKISLALEDNYSTEEPPF